MLKSLIATSFVISALVVSALPAGSACAEPASVETFRKEYAAGATALEGFYGRLRVHATHTYEGVERRTDLNLLSGGTSSRLVSRIVEASDPGEVGYTVVSVANDDLPFMLSRPSEGERYAVKDARDVVRRVEYNRTSAAPLFAPFCFYEARILDLLADKQFNVIGVSTFEDKERGSTRVRLDWEQQTTELFKSTGAFVFVPKLSWALVEFENRRQGSSDSSASCLHARIRYERQIGPFPLVKVVEYWAELKCGSGERKNVERFDIEEISEAQAQPGDFSPLEFGVNGLEPRHPANRVWMMLALGGALIALAIIIRVRRRAVPER